MQLLCMVLCIPSVLAFYPYGISVGDTKLTGNNSTAISLDPPFPFYGRAFDFVRVYRDGFVAFQDDTTKIDSHYIDEQPILVPLIGPWISRISSKEDDDNFNRIFYRKTTDEQILTNVSEFAMKYQEFGDLFVAKYVVIVTWENVTTDSYDEDPMHNKTNTFQLVITTDGSKSFCSFHYDRIEWIFYDDYSFYDDYDINDLIIKTQIGFYKGDIISTYILPASMETLLFDVLSDSNVGQLGLYAFRVDTIPTNLTILVPTRANISLAPATASVYTSSGIATTTSSTSTNTAFLQTISVDTLTNIVLSDVTSSNVVVTNSMSNTEAMVQETSVTGSFDSGFSTGNNLVFESLTQKLETSYSEISTSLIFTSLSMSSDCETSHVVTPVLSAMQSPSEIPPITSYISPTASSFSEISPDAPSSSLSYNQTESSIANMSSNFQTPSLSGTPPLESLTSTHNAVSHDSTTWFIPTPTIADSSTTLTAASLVLTSSTAAQEVTTDQILLTSVMIDRPTLASEVSGTLDDASSSPTIIISFQTPILIYTDADTATTVGFQELTATDVSWHLVSTSDTFFVSKQSNDPIVTNSDTETSRYSSVSATPIIYPEDSTRPALSRTTIPTRVMNAHEDENVEDVVIGVATTCGIVAVVALALVGILMWRVSRRNRVSCAPNNGDTKNITDDELIINKVFPPVNHKIALEVSRTCAVILMSRPSSSQPFVK